MQGKKQSDACTSSAERRPPQREDADVWRARRPCSPGPGGTFLRPLFPRTHLACAAGRLCAPRNIKKVRTDDQSRPRPTIASVGVRKPQDCQGLQHPRSHFCRRDGAEDMRMGEKHRAETPATSAELKAEIRHGLTSIWALSAKSNLCKLHPGPRCETTTV